MREAIGTSFIVNFIIVFFVIFIAFFVGNITYTKAFKVKNKIIDEIESFDGTISSDVNVLNSDLQAKIDAKMSEVGYRISNNTTCDTHGRYADSQVLTKNQSSTTYRYCIYKNTNSKGTYYGVVAYMYFEVPIIGAKLEIPIYGETRTFMNWERG